MATVPVDAADRHPAPPGAGAARARHRGPPGAAQPQEQFCARYYVFPGGVIDPEDWEPRAGALRARTRPAEGRGNAAGYVAFRKGAGRLDGRHPRKLRGSRPADRPPRRGSPVRRSGTKEGMPAVRRAPAGSSTARWTFARCWRRKIFFFRPTPCIIFRTG